jgi:hypothetical protein
MMNALRIFDSHQAPPAASQIALIASFFFFLRFLRFSWQFSSGRKSWPTTIQQARYNALAIGLFLSTKADYFRAPAGRLA